MPQIIEAEEQQESDHNAQAAERQNEQRATLRLCLNEIASEVTAALRDASLTIPVYFSVPSCGALVSFCTPTDPTDQEWAKATAIIVHVVGSKIKARGLVSRPLACAAMGISANAAEVSMATGLP
jgi:hypothetical protein